MSNEGNIKTMELSKILNYAENPRHDVGTDEIDTMKKLIDKVKPDNMYNLAKDIFENGLIGSTLPVLVFDSQKKKYIVYEGNRRIACLKFLDNPDILTTIAPSLKQKIETLKKSENAAYSTKIPCYITNEETALKIMERLHSGEDQGRGPKRWSSKEKGVFQKRVKQKNPMALAIVEATAKFLGKDITTKIDYTTIGRFFNNKDVKMTLGISAKEGSGFTEENILLIDYLIDKAIARSVEKKDSLTRVFNKGEEISGFLVPLINEYRISSNSKSNETNSDDQQGDISKNTESKDDKTINNDGNIPAEINTDSDQKTEKIESSNEKNDSKLVLCLKKQSENQVYFTNQTIDLKGMLELVNDETFEPKLLVIECSDLVIANGIVQPDNLPKEYNITYKYYMDDSRESVYWQDSLKINIKPKKIPHVVAIQQTVISQTFLNKYYDQLVFEHAEKLKPLVHFLATESKNGKYSSFINIVSRMFLEYTFRMYASKVLKDDNQTIEDRSKSLQGLIDYCCIKIEQTDTRKFVKHITRGRTDATKKMDILQKSVHYYDVTISNDDIQAMFNNLNLYLEHVYEEIIGEYYQKPSE